MDSQTQVYLTKLQSTRYGIKQGWYTVDPDGNPRFGPFATREACIDHATPPAR
jgi:hypothetical protein